MELEFLSNVMVQVGQVVDAIKLSQPNIGLRKLVNLYILIMIFLKLLWTNYTIIYFSMKVKNAGFYENPYSPIKR